MNSLIKIESINIGDPDMKYQEFVTIVNSSDREVYLDGWKVIWQEWPSQRILHKYVFSGWRGEYKFDPREKIFLTSGIGRDQFFDFSESEICSIPHHVIYTDTEKHICTAQQIRVSLWDDKNNEIDHLFSHQYKERPSTRPAIVIGHGRDPSWRDLLEHLRDKQNFEVEAFETEERAGHTIPDVIKQLGSHANLAILVLTGEDEMKDGSKHPRLNVIQELGKFQEHFGNNKTIILAEKDVIIPSNNAGIVYIPFEPGQIKSAFGDIIAVIRREFNL